MRIVYVDEGAHFRAQRHSSNALPRSFENQRNATRFPIRLAVVNCINHIFLQSSNTYSASWC